MRKCCLPAFSPFPSMFSKAYFIRVVKSQYCVVKSQSHNHLMLIISSSSFFEGICCDQSHHHDILQSSLSLVDPFSCTGLLFPLELARLSFLASEKHIKIWACIHQTILKNILCFFFQDM